MDTRIEYVVRVTSSWPEGHWAIEVASRRIGTRKWAPMMLMGSADPMGEWDVASLEAMLEVIVSSAIVACGAGQLELELYGQEPF